MEEFDKSVTLTPDEASKIMRDAGMKISTETLRNAIEQGKVPFGFCVQGDSRIFFIFRIELLEYLYQKCGYIPGEATA